jgi:plastocyanin
MDRHRLFSALFGLGALLALAACGGSSTAGGPAPPAGSVGGNAGAGHCPATAGLPASVSDHGVVAATGGQLAIAAGDFFFSPTCETGVAAGTVTLTVRNTGQALHNVSIPAQHIDMDVAPGQTITVRVRMGSAPLVYFCKYHRGSGMLGALLPAGTASRGCCCAGASACAGVGSAA